MVELQTLEPGSLFQHENQLFKVHFHGKTFTYYTFPNGRLMRLLNKTALVWPQNE